MDSKARGDNRQDDLSRDSLTTVQVEQFKTAVVLNGSRGARAWVPGFQICAMRNRFVVPGAPNGIPAEMTMV